MLSEVERRKAVAERATPSIVNGAMLEFTLWSVQHGYVATADELACMERCEAEMQRREVAYGAAAAGAAMLTTHARLPNGTRLGGRMPLPARLAIAAGAAYIATDVAVLHASRSFLCDVIFLRASPLAQHLRRKFGLPGPEDGDDEVASSTPAGANAHFLEWAVSERALASSRSAAARAPDAQSAHHALNATRSWAERTNYSETAAERACIEQNVARTSRQQLGACLGAGLAAFALSGVRVPARHVAAPLSPLVSGLGLALPAATRVAMVSLPLGARVCVAAASAAAANAAVSARGELRLCNELGALPGSQLGARLGRALGAPHEAPVLRARFTEQAGVFAQRAAGSLVQGSYAPAPAFG